MMEKKVTAWEEQIVYPTYEVGAVDTNPMFLENRVYQGSSGSVYPYGVIDSISDHKCDKSYRAVYIENDYIRIMLLPELGGRIHRAYDKVKQRDFVYHNEVVKPALVGLTGPWISGGIEFNWPQHHRPSTFMPADYSIKHNNDGSVTVWIGEIEHMYGLQVSAGFTLHPHKALIEITGRVFNGTDVAKQFLWWSNPAVTAGDGHQSIFPPDVTAVFDHGKRDVSDFPIATGTYYKVDYSPGTDISRYSNIPVPTSYMAASSDYDFVGAYDHNEQGGLLHVANHHIAPGKKQWTWGNCDFGLAWDRNLTDNNGPYIELMTGVFTDNQPDFTWIDPNEEKSFVQCFLPYSDLGDVHNANTELALNLTRKEDGKFGWGIYAISPLDSYQVIIRDEITIYLDEILSLKTGESLKRTLDAEGCGRLTIEICSQDGFKHISYQEHIDKQELTPDPATAPNKPEAVESIDELYFIGQHLEQYHHATTSAVNYYLEAVSRDPKDYRNNLAIATLEYERGEYLQAKKYAQSALDRAHCYNKNPVCGKASFTLGCITEKLGELESAFSHYFKSTWSGNYKDTGFYAVARISLIQNNYHDALDYVEQSLAHNTLSNNAASLKAIILTKLGRHQQALEYIDQMLSEHPLGYALYFQRAYITNLPSDWDALTTLCQERDATAIHLCNLYRSFGQDKMAAEVIVKMGATGALPTLLLAALQPENRDSLLTQAENNFETSVLFPNTLGEHDLLSSLTDSPQAKYLLGCFHYAKKSYEKAAALWKDVLVEQPSFIGAYRCLAIYSFNKQNDVTTAIQYLNKAFELNSNDARVLFELDHLKKRALTMPEYRLQMLELHQETTLKRDDLCSEYLALLNWSRKHDVVECLLTKRNYHPWEGGEGKITEQYLIHKQLQAIGAIHNNQLEHALVYLQSALSYPENVGEGRLVGQTDNDIYFLLGETYRLMGDKRQAQNHFEKASAGTSEITESKYYNDQPADYLFYQGAAAMRLGQADKARQLFSKMKAWGQTRISDTIEHDFFAVSLPDLVVFDADIQENHKIHCLFVQYMGELGLNAVDALNTTDGFDISRSIKIKEMLQSTSPLHVKAMLIEYAVTSVLFKKQSKTEALCLEV
ncbi:DUF5107 domain-containing protein [Psychromonas ossibalaenae]|uniref:DUF5107 domain-containing protein n=1 Tax=Psychromonas ossibalaenae TaxID=444922 RepID=UPI0003621022|nr:DUF5107 domain-containing protein [Psychromonas ossibalaenae]